MKLFKMITVDLYQKYPLEKFYVQQNNIGRGVIVRLTAGGVVVDPTGETVRLWAKRPGGHVSYLSCTVQPDGTIKAPFTNQMLLETGTATIMLELTNGEDDITTPLFEIFVEKNIADHDALESTDEFSALLDSLKELEELKENGLKGDVGPKGATGATGATFTPSIDSEGYLNWENDSGLENPDPVKVKEVVFGKKSTFPANGSEDTLYVDTSVTESLFAYRWNGTSYVGWNADTVDPMEATEEGVPADALKTKEYLTKLNKTTTNIDFSNWDNGSFTERLSDGTTVDYAVTFDSDGKPTKINDCTITW